MTVDLVDRDGLHHLTEVFGDCDCAERWCAEHEGWHIEDEGVGE